MWERLRLGELEQTHTNVQTHSHTLPSVMNMKSTGGLEKHVHHQDCSRLWELNLRDRIPRFSWQIVNPVTPTTVRQIKGKRGGAGCWNSVDHTVRDNSKTRGNPHDKILKWAKISNISKPKPTRTVHRWFIMVVVGAHQHARGPN